ncbi:hypothetical protein KUV89_17770 [Marinobacter hydrocarbonoclasticus]|nr:hypothetical protein [Marinobacter nauticus]
MKTPILLVAVLCGVLACSPVSEGDKVAIPLTSEQPHLYGYAEGVVESVKGETVIVKVVTATDVPQGHKYQRDIEARGSLYLSKDEFVDVQQAQTQYAERKAFAQQLQRLNTSIFLTSGKGISCGQFSHFAKTTSIPEAQSIGVLCDYIGQHAAEIDRTVKPVKPHEVAEAMSAETTGVMLGYLDLYIPVAESVEQALETVTWRATGHSEQVVQRLRAIAEQNRNTPAEALYDVTVDNLSVPVAHFLLSLFRQDSQFGIRARQFSEDAARNYFDAMQRIVVKVAASEGGSGTYSMALSDLESQRKAAFISEKQEAALSQVFFSEGFADLSTEAGVAEAIEKLKAESSSFSQIVGQPIVDAEVESRIAERLAKREEARLARERHDAEQAEQQLENARASLLSQVDTEQLFSPAAAEAAYQVLKDQNDALYPEQNLITESDRQMLLAAVQENLPGKEVATTEATEKLANSVPLEHIMPMDKVAGTVAALQMEIDDIAVRTGLQIPTEQLTDILNQRSKDATVLMMKEKPFEMETVWHVRIYDLQSDQRWKFKEREIVGTVDMADWDSRRGQGNCTFKAPLTSLGSEIAYPSAWRCRIQYVPVTGNVVFSITGMIDAPRGAFRSWHGNKGLLQENGEYRIVRGEMNRSKSFVAYEMSVDPFAQQISLSVPTTAHRTLVGRSTSLGLEVYALSDQSDWCSEEVSLQLESAHSGFFTNEEKVSTFVRKIGKAIESECSSVKSTKLYGTNGGDEVLYHASATKEEEWVPVGL